MEDSLRWSMNHLAWKTKKQTIITTVKDNATTSWTTTIINQYNNKNKNNHKNNIVFSSIKISQFTQSNFGIVPIRLVVVYLLLQLIVLFLHNTNNTSVVMSFTTQGLSSTVVTIVKRSGKRIYQRTNFPAFTNCAFFQQQQEKQQHLKSISTTTSRIKYSTLQLSLTHNDINNNKYYHKQQHQQQPTFIGMTTRQQHHQKKQCLLFSTKVLKSKSSSTSLSSSSNNNNNNSNNNDKNSGTSNNNNNISTSTSKIDFQPGSKIQVEITNFGPLGASVDVVAVNSHDINDIIPESQQPYATGLILQREIKYYRERRNNIDIIIGEILPAYIERVRDSGTSNDTTNTESTTTTTTTPLRRLPKLDVSLRSYGGKDKAIDASQLILQALQDSITTINNIGTINVGDNSTPEDIAKVFPGITKSTFKKAVSALYKQQLVIPSKYSIQLAPKKEQKPKPTTSTSTTKTKTTTTTTNSTTTFSTRSRNNNNNSTGTASNKYKKNTNKSTTTTTNTKTDVNQKNIIQ